MTKHNLNTTQIEKLFVILDEECALTIPCKNALDLTITELDIDSMELSNLSYIVGREFNLRFDFENISSKTTFAELFKNMILITE